MSRGSLEDLSLMLCIQVYDMERRQAAASEREARKAARVALKERQERERNTKLKMEEEAYEMQLQVTSCILLLLLLLVKCNVYRVRQSVILSWLVYA